MTVDITPGIREQGVVTGALSTITDATQNLLRAAVRNILTTLPTDLGLTVHAYVHDLPVSIKLAINRIAKVLDLAGTDPTGRLRVLMDINAAQTLGTVTTVATVTSLSQVGTVDARQGLLVDMNRGMWAMNVRSRITG